jgi:hypothetical protein
MTMQVSRRLSCPIHLLSAARFTGYLPPGGMVEMVQRFGNVKGNG